MEPHRGTTILVLGIIGVVLCPICGIIAWVMGNGDLKKIAAGTMDPAGQSHTNIGKILGIVAVCLMALGIIAQIVLVVVGGGVAAMEGIQ